VELSFGDSGWDGWRPWLFDKRAQQTKESVIMKLGQVLRKGVWWFVIAGLVGVLGCSEPSVYEPEEPTLPTSNGRIVGEILLGTPTMTNSIHGMYEGHNSLAFYRGMIDNNDVIGSATRQGQTQWQVGADPGARCLCPVPPNNIGLVEGVVSVGDIDSDDNGDYEGLVRLAGAGGTQIDELLISRAGSDIWFNSLDLVRPLLFIAAGGMETAGKTRPFVATFEIGPDSTLVMGSEFMFTDLQQQYFREVAVDPLKVTNDAFVCYGMARQYANSLGAESVPIHAIGVTTTGTPAFEVKWTAEITPANPLDMFGGTDCLVVLDQSIYFAGWADIDKESNPSNGGYWDAGFVSSVSVDGTSNWLRMVSLTAWSERFSGLYADQSTVYAVGKYGAYQKGSAKEQFSLALLSMFDPVTGDEKYHLGLGNSECASSFNSVLVQGSRAYCSGFTNHFILDEGRQAWFAEVSLDNPVQANRVELPEGLSTGSVSERYEAPRVKADNEPQHRR